MVNILLVSKRQDVLDPFVQGLQSDADVHLELIDAPAQVLDQVRKQPPHLVIIDYHLADMLPLDLAKELLQINALVNIAVVSTMNEEDFHEASEGLGLLPRLPSPPLVSDAPVLLQKLREVTGVR